MLLGLALVLAAAPGCGGNDDTPLNGATLSPSGTATTGGSPSPLQSGSPSPSGVTLSPGDSASPSPSYTPDGGQTITDESIKHSIVQRLGESPALVGVRIRVSVKDKVVYLMGKVDKAQQKETAEQIAVTEPGIVKVVSFIRVREGGSDY